jgi:hypothetical protein
LHGLFAPAAAIVAVAGGAALLGASAGLVVLGCSMVGAAGTAGLLLTQTRSMEPDDDPAQPTGRDDQTAVGIRSALTDDPEIENTSRQAVVTRFAAGLFVQSAAAVLYLGGLFG